jgi:DNA-binding NtrC family response regulator
VNFPAKVCPASADGWVTDNLSESQLKAMSNSSAPLKLLWIAPPADGMGATLASLEEFDFHVDLTRDPLDALGRMRQSRYAALLVSPPVPPWTLEEVLEEAQRANGRVPVIVHLPRGSVQEAVRLTRLGALDVLTAETNDPAFVATFSRALEPRRFLENEAASREADTDSWRSLLVGESQAIRNVCEIIRLVGSRRCTVLITGETGTGKEVVARALHRAGPRAAHQLVCVNCGAIPEDLLEAELFGHVKGAFTGAIQHRVGRFEQANRGTLFLDEVGDMPLETQGKLLRVLQEREIQRLGSSETVKVDVRVVAATNLDLAERVERGRFREDLYYRLNVVPVVMSPLRERPRDIPPLVHHFLEKICRQEEIPLRRVAPETLERLSSYTWPGNVRQLENAMEMAIALSDNRLTLYPSDFPLPSSSRKRPAASGPALVSLPEDGIDYEQTVSGFERNILEQALRRTRGNKKAAADMLRLKRTTLSAKLKSLEIWTESMAAAG